MKRDLNIIHVEDNPDDADLTQIALRKAGMTCCVKVVTSRHEFIDAIGKSAPDLILCDHSLPGFDSMEAFEIMKDRRPHTPFILLTGSVSESFAVDCLLMGVDDYILKSNMIRLPSSIERVLSKKQIKDERDTIEAIHLELQDSINYAKRIQDAVLPEPSDLEDTFHDAFVYYKPRDIVSGDMFWLADTKTKDERGIQVKVLAAYDCTGHGIPGAFMSLLSFALLNETLQNKWVNYPSDILSYMNKKLPAILNKRREGHISDGFDIAVCAFDLENRIMYFSGANRPVWVLRRNGELQVQRGARVGIGWQTGEDYKFDNVEVQLECGDRIFLFSDGITDQFGGPDGKKLSSKRLKELLVNTASLTFTQQKKYLVTLFEGWKDNFDQVDDQLFIGVEIE
jgi:phosphoserine phosphatase RsbU/P